MTVTCGALHAVDAVVGGGVAAVVVVEVAVAASVVDAAPECD